MVLEPWTSLIGVGRVNEIHQEVITRYGGDQNPFPKEGCIEKSLGAAWNAELYTAGDAGKPGLCFAACLLFYLAKKSLLY